MTDFEITVTAKDVSKDIFVAFDVSSAKHKGMDINISTTIGGSPLIKIGGYQYIINIQDISSQILEKVLEETKNE